MSDDDDIGVFDRASAIRIGRAVQQVERQRSGAPLRQTTNSDTAKVKGSYPRVAKIVSPATVSQGTSVAPGTGAVTVQFQRWDSGTSAWADCSEVGNITADTTFLVGELATGDVCEAKLIGGYWQLLGGVPAAPTSPVTGSDQCPCNSEGNPTALIADLIVDITTGQSTKFAEQYVVQAPINLGGATTVVNTTDNVYQSDTFSITCQDLTGFPWEYQANHNYLVGDLISVQTGESGGTNTFATYQCITEHTSAATWTTSGEQANWEVVEQSGDYIWQLTIGEGINDSTLELIPQTGEDDPVAGCPATTYKWLSVWWVDPVGITSFRIVGRDSYQDYANGNTLPCVICLTQPSSPSSPCLDYEAQQMGRTTPWPEVLFASVVDATGQASGVQLSLDMPFDKTLAFGSGASTPGGGWTATGTLTGFSGFTNSHSPVSDNAGFAEPGGSDATEANTPTTITFACSGAYSGNFGMSTEGATTGNQVGAMIGSQSADSADTADPADAIGSGFGTIAINNGESGNPLAYLPAFTSNLSSVNPIVVRLGPFCVIKGGIVKEFFPTSNSDGSYGSFTSFLHPSDTADGNGVPVPSDTANPSLGEFYILIEETPGDDS